MADPPGAGGGRFDYTYLDPSSDPLALPADRPFSSTDPTSALQYRQRVNKNRRRHTTLEEEPYEEQSGQQLPENDAQFRQEVFNTIKSRLREEGIHAQDLGERFFGWCLPKYGASRQDWSRLLHHSLFLPNEKLETLLSLEKVGQATRVDKEKLALFYIRTFALTISELAGVLQVLVDEDMRGDTFLMLVDLVGTLEDTPDTIVYLRYCGSTGTGNAWLRHVDDLRNIPPSFLGRLLQALLDECPEVVDAAEVHEVTEATFRFPVDQSLIDVREQALIALFGLDSLLNTVPGGHGLQYNLDEEDETQFHDMRTNLIERFSLQCEPCSSVIDRGIQQYAASVQQYCIGHATTGTDRVPYSDQLRDLVTKQAIPATILGEYAIMTTIGSDITQEQVRLLMPFF